MGTVLQTRLQSVSDLQDNIPSHSPAWFLPPLVSSLRQSHSRDSSLQMYSEISETAVSRQQSARCMDPRRPGPWHPSAVDLKATPGCQLLKGEADPKANFPDCCPVYDCEEGVEVKYVEPPKPKKAEAPGESSE